MKEKLTAIFNVMQTIETKGESTLAMADCIRSLYQIIQEVEREQTNENVG